MTKKSSAAKTASSSYKGKLCTSLAVKSNKTMFCGAPGFADRARIGRKLGGEPSAEGILYLEG